MTKQRNKGRKVAAGIKKLEDGRWKYRARVTRQDRYLDRERTAPAEWTLNEVKIARIRLQDELADELSGKVLPKAKETTVTDYVVRWLEAKAERAEMRKKPKTAREYRKMLEGWILPVLGEIRIQELNRSDIADWSAWAEKRTVRGGSGASQATLDGAWRVVRMLVRDLGADYRLDADRLLHIQPPESRRRVVREQRTLTAVEVHRLLVQVASVAPGRHAEVATLAWTGIRPGALYALKVGDLDRERGVLRIERAVSWGDQGPEVGGTKTHTAREVPVTPELVAILDAHRERMLREQHPGLASGLLFPISKLNRWGTWHRKETSLRRVLRKAERGLGLDLRLGTQVLRRTFNTLLIAAGVPAELVRDMTGHQSPAMTQRYLSGANDVKRAAITRALHVEVCDPSM
jgi:integrase